MTMMARKPAERTTVRKKKLPVPLAEVITGPWGTSGEVWSCVADAADFCDDDEALAVAIVIQTRNNGTVTMAAWNDPVFRKDLIAGAHSLLAHHLTEEDDLVWF
jgi:hypothetical protein